MRSRMSSGNHPKQPLSPKHQPWFRAQAPNRSLANVNMSRSATESRLFGAPAQTVEQELVVRARIRQRSAEKLEKLHDAVNHDRFLREYVSETRKDVIQTEAPTRTCSRSRWRDCEAEAKQGWCATCKPSEWCVRFTHWFVAYRGSVPVKETPTKNLYDN